MNNLKALLLIPVLIIQLSGILTNKCWESFQLAELSEKVCPNINRETITKTTESTNYLVILKNEKIGCVNSPICCKETTIECLDQPEIISKKKENLPVKKTTENNQRPLRRVSLISHIRFIGPGSGELF